MMVKFWIAMEVVIQVCKAIQAILSYAVLNH